MTLTLKLAAAAVALAAVAGTPALADDGRGKSKEHRHLDRHDHRGDRSRDRERVRFVADCPPGLAKKNPPCIPPGQAKKHGDHYGTRIGDILRVGDYRIIRDHDRYRLEDRRGWTYYRDADRVYRVDSETRKILAVLNLIEALTN